MKEQIQLLEARLSAAEQTARPSTTAADMSSSMTRGLAVNQRAPAPHTTAEEELDDMAVVPDASSQPRGLPPAIASFLGLLNQASGSAAESKQAEEQIEAMERANLPGAREISVSGVITVFQTLFFSTHMYAGPIHLRADKVALICRMGRDSPAQQRT
jgi:hypothetical protein